MSGRRVRNWRWFAALAAAPVIGMVWQGTASGASGDISRFAGTYAAGFSGDGGAASAAQLNGPTGVAVAADGRVFIADRVNNRIRVVDTAGVISTLASGLLNPVDVAVDDAAGLLYFSEDADPFVNRLSQIDIGGGPAVVTVIAGGGSSGYGGDGGPAAGATFRSIGGIDVGPDGDVYIADRGNNRIRRIDVATGNIDLFAGTGTGGGDNGDALTVATFAGPKDVAVSTTGVVYVADEGTNLVRVIEAGQVAVFAGNYSSGFSGDGGPATSAALASPDGVAVAPNGDVYIADTGNNRVRRVDTATDVITTIAGTGACCAGGDGGPATSAAIGNPVRLDVDLIGNIWIAAEPEHAIRMVEGAPTADAGGPYAIAEGDDLSLDASASVARPGATYAWDLDGDSVFDDATGSTPTVLAADLIGLGLADGPIGPITVTVQITDGTAVATADSSVTVSNVAPTATVAAPGTAVAGAAVTVDLGAVDPGPIDAAADFSYQIDWDGDGTVDDTVTGPADHSVSHTFATAGPFDVTVVAVDKDGGASSPVVASIVVSAAPTTSSTTTTSTTVPTTTATTPATTAGPTLAPVLPPTGGTTTNQVVLAAILVLAGAALLVTRAVRSPGAPD